MGGRAKAAAQKVSQATEIGSIEDLIALVQDEDKVKAFLVSLNRLKTELNDAVMATAKLDEIDGLLIRARDNQRMAAEELDQAKRQAVDIKAKAKVESGLDEATAEAAKILATAKARRKEVETLAERESKALETAQNKLREAKAEADESHRKERAGMDEEKRRLKALADNLAARDEELERREEAFGLKAAKAREIAEVLTG